MATMASYISPSEDVIKTITSQLPCRDRQIRALFTLLSPTSPFPRNIVLHGLTATGKSSICSAVMRKLDSVGDDSDSTSRNFAIIKSAECITSRHLLERTVGEVAKALLWKGKVEKCEDAVRLVEVLEKMFWSLRTKADGGVGEEKRKFILVLDGIDKQRDAPGTLLPALGRLSEVIPDLTTIFILTTARPHFLHTCNPVYINFPAYTKPEALSILSANPPALASITPILPIIPIPPPTTLSGEKPLPTPTEEQLKNLWTRYLAAVWDTFASHSGRDLASFRYLALKLWTKFVAPIKAGKFLATDFQRLFISQRALFRDESILVPSIVAPRQDGKVLNSTVSRTVGLGTTTSGGLGLPYTSQILLLAAYLCSYIPARNDVTIFSKLANRKRKRRGVVLGQAGGTVKGGGARRSKNSLAQRRRIDRKLLGPQAFVVERLMAVFWCVWEEASHSSERTGRGVSGGRKGVRELGGSADILAQVATLSSLRLLVRTGKEELDGGSKYRVNVGWEVVRSLGRGVGVELGEWLE